MILPIIHGKYIWMNFFCIHEGEDFPWVVFFDIIESMEFILMREEKLMAECFEEGFVYASN